MFPALVKSRLSSFFDNAMFYKDITQWLRGKTFSALFFGMLLASLVICLLTVAGTADQEGKGGPIAFGFLSGLLGLYTLIIGFTGYTLMMQEFQSQTFELYELCGMSLERMIWGKVSSMLGQFLFGFFCVVPFLFISYLFGGLDFIQVLCVVVVFTLAAPVYFLAMLLASLGTKSVKVVRSLIQGAMILFLSIFLPYTVLIILFFFGSRGRNPLEEMIKLILELDKGALAAMFLGLFIYAQGLLLLFYLACHAISPVTDTRETPVKLLSFTLSLSSMGFCFLKEEFTVAFIFILLALGMCAGGALFFYEPMRTPLMARRRQTAAKRALPRFVHYVFRANPWGTFRTLLLIWCGLLAFHAVRLDMLDLLHQYSIIAGPPGIFPAKAFNFALAAPFYVAFPGVLLFLFRKTRENLALARMLLFIWWCVSGALLLICYGIAHNIHQYSVLEEIAYFLCIALSPLSALGVFDSNISVNMSNAMGCHVTMGFLGFCILYATCRRREKALLLEKNAPPQAEPPPAGQSAETLTDGESVS